jgi:hypothetical protein
VQWIIDNGWYPVPVELTRPYHFALLGLTLDHFFGTLMVSGLFLLLGFALLMVFYAIFYAFLGPRRYGPLDAPPIRRKVRPSR